MSRTVVAAVTTFALFSWVALDSLGAANPRNHIEAARRQAVVYIGVIDSVTLDRNQPRKAKAEVEILAVARSGANTLPTSSTLEYNTWADKTAPLAGGLQYQLGPGDLVVVFAESFDGPGYVLHGSREELAQQVAQLQESLIEMSESQLAFNEIDPADRKLQIDLYDELSDHLDHTELTDRRKKPQP